MSCLERDTELQPILSNKDASDHVLASTSKGDPDETSPSTLVANESHSKQSSPRPWRVLFKGWRFTIFLAFVSSLVVLFFNAGFLIYTATHPHHGDKRVLYDGDCHKATWINTGIHLLINALSTILLGASNFGMQCLSAPSRKDIDRAHKEGRWLDIGVPSVRNLFRVSWKRSFSWIGLSFSSLPFHLFYNSAIYPTIAVPAYDIFTGPASLGQSEWSDVQLMVHHSGDNSSSVHRYGSFYNFAPDNTTSKASDSLLRLFSEAKKGALQNLTNVECITQFGTTYQKAYSKLLLVTRDAVGNNSYIHLFTDPVYNRNGQYPDPAGTAAEKYSYRPIRGAGPFDWICPFNHIGCESSDLPSISSKAQNGNWTVWDWIDQDDNDSWLSEPELPRFKVDYCLAMEMPQRCTLRYSLLFTMLVVAANLIKTGILLYMWLGISNVPLLTIGDTIASFLRHPDPHTRGACFLTMSSIETSYKIRGSSALVGRSTPLNPAEVPEKRKYWGYAVSKKRWALGISLWVCGAVLCFTFLGLGAWVNIWKLEFGTVDANAIVSAEPWPDTAVLNVLIANSPQLIYSVLYFTMNGILTSMCLADEWSRFSISRKGLRVSNNPKVAQRSNYFLSVPYRYAAPLMISSAILHWLIAESLFLVAVEAYDTQLVRIPSGDVYSCAFSLLAIVCGISVAVIIFFSIVGLSFRKFVSPMPLAGSNSLAIAAACHPTFNPNLVGDPMQAEREINSEDEEDDMALLPVKWGAIPVEGPIGHCSFTSGHVDSLEEGKKYQ
ncbi:unnamed protein product [Penicillium salamii]|nr:unnamed protein product [Penicillium salamii]